MSTTFPFLVNLSPYYAREEGLAWLEALKGRAEHDEITIYVALPCDILHAFAEKEVPPFLVLGSKSLESVAPGSFTKSVAGELCKSFGSKFVMLGTKWMQRFEHETDADLPEKIKCAKEADIISFVCIGETAEERQPAAEVLKRQLSEAIQGFSPEELTHLQVIYEAPWIDAAYSCPTHEELENAYKVCCEAVHSLLPEAKVYCPVPYDLKDTETFIHTLHADGFYFTDPHQLTSIDEAALRAKAATARKAREAAKSIEAAPPVVPEKVEEEEVVEEVEELEEEEPEEEEAT